MKWLKRKSIKPSLPGPVVVGGVGGSGTRVLAQCLFDLGYYLGGHLNPALDNLWYTLLLRRSQLFPRSEEGIWKEIDDALRLFGKAMTEGLEGNFSKAERALIDRALRQSLGVSRDSPLKAQRSLLASRPPDPKKFRAWGWKEPNTHIHLAAISRAFPRLKYIHLTRHGLDMAFSRNRGQLQRWGSHFGVPFPERQAEVPAAALRYWVRANRAAIEQAQALLGPRFLLLNFDQLCADPAPQMDRFLGFIEADPGVELRQRLILLPQRPPSTGRYREKPLSIFAPEDIEAVRELGFSVEAPDPGGRAEHEQGGD